MLSLIVLHERFAGGDLSSRSECVRAAEGVVLALKCVKREDVEFFEPIVGVSAFSFMLVCVVSDSVMIFTPFAFFSTLSPFAFLLSLYYCALFTPIQATIEGTELLYLTGRVDRGGESSKLGGTTGDWYGTKDSREYEYHNNRRQPQNSNN